MLYYDDCLSVETGTIHRETDLIRYTAKFLAKVYEIMIVYVMKIYNMNMKFYARMFDSKCAKNAYENIMVI